MAIDIVGPANAPNSTTIRPADTRTFGATDTWTKDCTSPAANDGTKIQAGFLNGLMGQFRNLIRGNGQTAGSADIVTLNNADDSMALKAIQHLIQRGQVQYAADTSGTANTVTVSLSPAAAEYKAGMTIRVKLANAINGPSVINANTLGNKPIVAGDGAATGSGDGVAGQILELVYDGTSFQIVGSQTRIVRTATTFYVNNSTGNDGNDGLTTGTAWATLTKPVTVLRNYNLNGNTVTIQLALTGIGYAPPPNFVAPSSGSLVIRGDPANQAGYVITGAGAGSGAPVLGVSGGQVSLVGLTLQNTGTTGPLLGSGGGAVVSCQNITFGTTVASPAPFALVQASGGNVGIAAGCIFSGSAYAMWLAQAAGQIIYAANMATANSPAFSGATVVVQSNGVVQASAGGFTWSGTGATGPRYSATLNGIIFTSASGPNYFPGNSAGTTATGGQYA